MNKKLYFGSAVAMLAMLASCSQDELGLVAEKPVSNDLAGRKTVGVVTFVDEATRFDYVNEHGEAGDVLGVYLMDKFISEYNNANDLPANGGKYWKNNTAWWNMYDLTNYISTNFSYTYDGAGKWENKQAELIEGNYFVTYPRCEEATNRRDLWHQLGTVKTLNRMNDAPWVREGRDNVYTNFENTFYVGYQRIYRDDEDQHSGAELKQSMHLYPASTDVHFVVADYDGGTNYRIKKISIRKKDGSEIPTLVYVRPENFDVVGSSEYNTDKGIYNNKFNQNSARAVVQFKNVPDATKAYEYVPYQYPGAAPSYEFSFLLPEENGFEMNASSAETEGRATSDRLDVYMTLPITTKADLANYEVVIYADQWVKEGVTRHWEEGVFESGMVSLTDNGDWTLDNIISGTENGLSQEGESTPIAFLKFDNKTWTPYANFGPVMSTADLLEKINSCKEEMAAKNVKKQKMTVVLQGEDIEITDEILDLLVDNNYKGENIKQDITLDIKKASTTETKQVIWHASKMIDNVEVAANVPVIIEARTVVACDENVIATVTNNGTLNLGNSGQLVEVTNNGVFNMNGTVNTVVNNANMTAGGAANVKNLTNYGTAVVNNLYVTGYSNNYGTVTVDGYLGGPYANGLDNSGVVNVNAGAYAHIDDTSSSSRIYVNDKTAAVQVWSNYGYIETKGEVELIYGNYSKINITEKISDVDANVIFVNDQTSGTGVIINNVCANIDNMPAYPYCKLTYEVPTLANFTTALANVTAYNHNGGVFTVLNVTSSAPVSGTLPATFKEANLNINSDDAKGTLALGAATVKLTGNATVKSGNDWTVNGDAVTDAMYIVVVDGGKLLGTAGLTADVDHNLDD